MDKAKMEMLQKYQEMLKDELFKDLGKDMDECACNYNKHKMIASVIKTINDINCLISYDNGDWSKDGSKPMEYSSKKKELTPEMATMWVDHMENADGTTGQHWAIADTTAVANSMGIMFDHIDEMDWWVALNAMYSDYYDVAVANGVDTPTFYAGLAKAFLFDKDAKPPKEKLHCYYEYIVKH